MSLEELMARPQVDHQALGTRVLKVVLSRTPLPELLAGADFPLELGLSLLRDGLFSSLLCQTVVANGPLEIVLTRLRAKMLEARIDEEDYIRPLALQGWNNQFVWACSEEEWERLKRLGKDHSLRACYGPSESVPPYLQRRFIEEPAEERRLSLELGRLSEETGGGVTSEVAEHYGKHPYPRYLGFSPPRPEDLRRRFPEDPVQVPSRPNILVAGCGTGRHALRTACRYGGSVTALDLSLPSLAYGARMARKFGLHNLSFVQGNLLELHRLEHQFDLVESVGVLHHLPDPAAGLSSLVKVLRPGGALRLGLYSKAGRVCVEEAKRVAKQLGFSPETLREFRQHLLSLPPEHPAHQVTHFQDFYSTSGALDLLFHPREQCFDLEEVETLIREAGLEFLGFDSLPAGVEKAYGKLFPSDPHKRNWTFWTAFEKLYPRSFRSMYQFWCYKKTP